MAVVSTSEASGATLLEPPQKKKRGECQGTGDVASMNSDSQCTGKSQAWWHVFVILKLGGSSVRWIPTEQPIYQVIELQAQETTLSQNKNEGQVWFISHRGASSLWVPDQPCLRNKFQDSQSDIVETLSQKQKNNWGITWHLPLVPIHMGVHLHRHTCIICTCTI